MDKEKGFTYYGQDIPFKSLNKVIKQSPQKINKNLKYKIMRHNLYVKNYREDVVKKISNKYLIIWKKLS